jgi:hypothetical protein
MRLELAHGRVRVGRIGPEVLDQIPSLMSADPTAAIGKHFVRYWQAHGGYAVLGRAITSVFTTVNEDGSGRAYEMQWFENARLEWHPEVRSPVFKVLLGLVGQEWLAEQGWARWRGVPAPRY